MFLNRLSADYNKVFLALCYKAIGCNNEITEEELAHLNQYAAELNTVINFDEYDSKSIDDIVTFLASTSITDKKIILSEMLGILMSDGVYDDIEKDFYRDVCAKLDIPHSLAIEIEKGVEEYIESFNRFAGLILNS